MAWRLSGKPREKGKNPPGSATRLATELCQQWQADSVVTVEAGSRGHLIRLAGDLATSPQPPEGTEAQSGNLTSPGVPIEAHAGGEGDEDSLGDPPEESGEVNLEPPPLLSTPTKIGSAQRRLRRHRVPHLRREEVISGRPNE